MRVLITGVTGFAGGHLAERLLRAGGHEVAGTSRRPAWPGEWLHLATSVRLHTIDWTDAAAVEGLLRCVEPEWLFHLAGYPHAGRSFREPDEAWAGTLTLTRTLYDAVIRWGGSPRILYTSSAMVYGEPDARGAAFTEGDLLKPVSPYAASKAAADLLSYSYSRHPGLDIVRARPFNHIGPKQSAEYAAPNFARQLAGIEAGMLPPVIETGDLSGWRDLMDVRDTVRAYQLLMERGRAGEVYNVASGTVQQTRAILDRLVALSGVRVEVREKVDPSRRQEPSFLRGDAAKLRQTAGWVPSYTLDQTLADMLADWRQRTGRLREGA
jgi:GDP-4-dehydro-6-deoxy-D-mannose reductase